MSPDGSAVFVTGTVTNTGGAQATVAYGAATGAIRWASFSSNHASTAALSPDGSKLFTGGTRFGTPPGDVYDTQGRNAATGHGLWTNVQESNPSTDTEVSRQYAMTVSPDSAKVFVTGLAQTAAGNWDFATEAYRA